MFQWVVRTVTVAASAVLGAPVSGFGDDRPVVGRDINDASQSMISGHRIVWSTLTASGWRRPSGKPAPADRTSDGRSFLCQASIRVAVAGGLWNAVSRVFGWIGVLDRRRRHGRHTTFPYAFRILRRWCFGIRQQVGRRRGRARGRMLPEPVGASMARGPSPMPTGGLRRFGIPTVRAAAQQIPRRLSAVGRVSTAGIIDVVI